jgi:hypothetical protein
MTPWRRVLVEKKGVMLPLALLAAANLAAYVLVVRPMKVRAAGVADRAQAAALARQDAERDEAAARQLVAGKAEADEELSTFYDKVLPASLPAARRLTYAPLPELARTTDVQYEERQSSLDTSMQESGIGRLESRMLLVGDYRDIRRFIYELETSPAFVIIDGVTIADDQNREGQSLTIQLSTYFRRSGDGS